jgi:hypothetical protein
MRVEGAATSAHAFNRLRDIAHFGFSLGKYSEVFIGGIPNSAALQFGQVEVTFGQPSPLIIYLFDGYLDKHYHGHWSNINTCRVFGCSSDETEVVLLNAFDRYEEMFGVLPHPIEVAAVEWADVTDGVAGDLTGAAAKMPAAVLSDLEPLRCFYYARTSVEPAAACIQYFRVLEYYAFLSLSRKLNLLRRDTAISDKDFFFQASQLFSKDERGPISRLIAQVSTPELLTQSAEAGLIERPDANLLGSSLYDFRNSLVHAKSDFRTTATVDPVISAPTKTNRWRKVLHQLAKAALESTASRRAISEA